MRKNFEELNKMELYGNKQADFINLIDLEDGRVVLESGHCCVKSMDAVVSVEFLTALIAKAIMEHGNIEGVIESFDWDEGFKNELKAKVKREYKLVRMWGKSEILHDYVKIPEALLILVENALGFKLYPKQRDYLLGITIDRWERQEGYTTAHAIRLALSKGEPLDIRQAKNFCDGSHTHNYAKAYYLPLFKDIWHKLRDYGIRVRDIGTSGMSIRGDFHLKL